MNMIFNKNLLYIQSKFSNLYKKLKNKKYQNIKKKVTIEKKLSLKLNITRDKYDMESFQSLSLQILKNQDKIENKEFIISKVVVLGSFDIVSINNFIENDSVYSILIYEDNLDLLYEMINQIDLAKFHESKKIFIATDSNDLKDILFEFLLDRSDLNHQILLNSSNKEYTLHLEQEYIGIFNEYFSLHFEAEVSSVQNKSINIKNGYSYLSVYNQFNNVELPILVLAPGPSLLQNINWVKENQNNFIVVAVGSALNILYENNIEVDIVFSLDIKIRIIDQFKQIDLKYLNKILLIANEATDPNVLKFFKNVILSEYTNITVNHFALNILLGLGHKLILTLGNDAAYGEDGKEYSKGIVFDKYEDKNYIEIKGNFKQSVISSYEFINHIKTYTLILSKYENISIFNLSNGAFINGMIPLKISEIQDNTFVNIGDKKLEYREVLNNFSYILNYFEDIKIIVLSFKKMKKLVIKDKSNNYKELAKKLSIGIKELRDNKVRRKLMNLLFHINSLIEQKDVENISLNTIYKNILSETIEIYLKSYLYLDSIHKENMILNKYLKPQPLSINKLVEINSVKVDFFLKSYIYKEKLKNINTDISDDGKFMVGLYLDTLDESFNLALENQLFNLKSHQNHLIKLHSIYEIMTKMKLDELENQAYKSLLHMFDTLFSDKYFLDIENSYIVKYIEYYYAFYLINRNVSFGDNIEKLGDIFQHLLSLDISVFELVKIYDYITFIYWGTMREQDDLKECNKLIIKPFSSYLNKYFKNNNYEKRVQTSQKKKQKVCFLLSKLVKTGTYSVGKVEYLLFQNLANYESEEYEFYCYEYWAIEEEYKKEIEQFGVKVKSFSSINDLNIKLQCMRDAFFDDEIDIVISDMPWGIPTYLFQSRVAPKQIYWSHGWHEYGIQSIDSRVSHMIPKSEYEFKTFNIAINLEHYNPKIDEKIVSRERKKYPNDKKILGMIGRLVKIDNDEYLSTVAKIMQSNNDTIFIAAGSGDTNGIKEKIKKHDLSDRFYFPGFVDSHIYGNIIELYLDPFPLGGGESLDEYRGKGKAYVSLHTNDWLNLNNSSNYKDVRVNKIEQKKDSFTLDDIRNIFRSAYESDEKKILLKSLYSRENIQSIKQYGYLIKENTISYQYSTIPCVVDIESYIKVANRLIADDELCVKIGEEHVSVSYYYSQKKLKSLLEVIDD